MISETDVATAKPLMRDHDYCLNKAAMALRVLSSDLDKALWVHIGRSPNDMFRDLGRRRYVPDF